ncbi:2-hydroxyacid dehydrogenase [Peptoniphilaceae bacterium SGI.097]
MKFVFTKNVPQEIVDQLPHEVEYCVPKSSFSEEELLKELQDADALITVGTRITEEFLEKWHPDSSERPLRVVGTVSVGYDHLPVDYCSAHGIAVVNTPQSVRYPTAELTVAIALNLLRKVQHYDARLRKSLRFEHGYFDSTATSIYGKTVGIFGLGSIGSKTAEVFHVLGAQILYTQRHDADAALVEKLGARRVQKEELFAQSDIISLHVPYVPEYHHLIDRAAIQTMKDGVILVNAGRGKLIDEGALIEGLKSGKIAGAALDVFENEPMISKELAAQENTVLTPHIGTYAFESRADMVKEAVENTLAVLWGKRPLQWLNQKEMK